MKHIEITQISTSQSFGGNDWYFKNGIWKLCDAYYDFYNTDKATADLGDFVFVDIASNLDKADFGIVGDFKWQVVEIE